MGRILGVDLGSKRIGLSLSDPSRTIASPLEMIQRSKTHDDDHARILAIAEREEADMIVVGLPINLQGKNGPAAKAVLEEVKALKNGTKLPVVTHDERLTTVTATDSLIEGGVKRAKRKGLVDKVAASVLLQTYLDQQ